MTFQKYEFREFEKAESKPDAAPYQAKRFDVQPEQAAAAAGARKPVHFALDQNVVGQLGIEEKERQAAELRVQKEIDRRWEQARDKAEVEGYTRGLEEGKREAVQAEAPRIKERLARLDHLLQEFDKAKERIFLANEAFLMELIAQVARMVVLKEVELDREYLHRVVIALIQQLGTREDMKIYLSEADYGNLEQLKQAVEKEFGKLSNTTIEAGPEIPAGGCKIETRFGVVDASVQTQIENVMKALKA